MTARKLALLILPAALMFAAVLLLRDHETWLASFGRSPKFYELLGHIGLALPYGAAAATGITFLFAARGSLAIRSAGQGVVAGGLTVVAIAILSEAERLAALAGQLHGGSVFSYLDFYSLSGASLTLGAGLFGFKVALKGDAAFGATSPKRLSGRRAVHGDSDWMDDRMAARLFPEAGGIVIGERYRVDRDVAAAVSFDPRDKESWGKGGSAPLVAFDCGFGSTHGIVFAGSGGYKTTSVVIPTALKFKGSMIVLDPSTEIAPMVAAHRSRHGQDVLVLDPKTPEIGFNILDWIGRFGNAPEEDIASVAAWLMSERPRITSGSDDFFRTSAEQLITGIIADVMLSDLEDKTRERSLRAVRRRVAEPEETLKEKLAELYECTTSRFVKEVIAPFINMTPQTFSGVYATAAKETHWLSYDNYAAIVSGSSFRTDDLANGRTTVFINVDLSTLENHPGLARVIIGALLKVIYNRNGDMKERTLFLIDEAARLGYMRIIETARDAGRKYGITLLMLFQSLGQMREAFGGRDATSKWFESASWVSFAAINDPETADYISKRCGMTTVEADQVSRTSRGEGHSRTRSKQLVQRPLIQPHEVMRMRADEQIVFTAGNPPLRCGRAIWFRRGDMKAIVGANRFSRDNSSAQ